MILSIEQLMQLPKAETMTQTVFVPEWKGEVVIKAINLAERDQMIRECNRVEDEFDSERWNIMALQNGLAEPKLSYDEAAQILQLAFGPVARLLEEIWKLSGLTPTGQLSQEAVDESEASFR